MPPYVPLVSQIREASLPLARFEPERMSFVGDQVNPILHTMLQFLCWNEHIIEAAFSAKPFHLGWIRFATMQQRSESIVPP